MRPARRIPNGPHILFTIGVLVATTICICGCVNWHYTQHADVSNDVKYQVAYKVGEHYRFIRDAVLVDYEPRDHSEPNLTMIWSIERYQQMVHVPTTSAAN